MVEKTESTIETPNYSITYKINAKQEGYGEFTVKAESTEVLEQRVGEASQILYALIAR
jgi:hypothetical protein